MAKGEQEQRGNNLENLTCEICHGEKFWISIFGSRFCISCNPPIDSGIVADFQISDFPKGGESSEATGIPSPVGRGAAATPEIEIRDFQFMPRGIEWPTAVLQLWPNDSHPDWLFTRLDVLYRIDRRPAGKGRGHEDTKIPVKWFKPIWTHPDHSDPLMPKPHPVARWAPNDLPCCWWCGLALFWVDDSDNERCAFCSPVPHCDWSRVVRWFLKPGFSNHDLAVVTTDSRNSLTNIPILV